jgi:hypothetical protein
VRAAGRVEVEPALGELEELARRRKEIERRLNGAGLRRAHLGQAPRWLEPRVQARLKAFGQELPSLGPLFCLFGQYLGTRLDLLHGADARDLARRSDHADPLQESEIRSLLRDEIGRESETLRLESAPLESRALFQRHRAVLADGRRVLVKIARMSAQSRRDLAALPHLAEHLSSLGWPLRTARRLLKDFNDLVARRMNLGHEAVILQSFRDRPDEPRLRAPRVVDACSSAHVLTIEVPQGARAFPVRDAKGETEVQAVGASRIVTDLWMRRIFDDFQIAEELPREEVWSHPGGEVELSGGLFHPISAGDADALRSYLVAAGRDDPDDVFYALKRLTDPADEEDSERFRHHLGHVVPRRDGRFGEAPPGFPEFLLSHWRQLERHGLVPNPSLLAFYRGLISLRELTGPALSHEVLKEAVQAAQVSQGHQQLRKALDPSRLSRFGEVLVKTLIDLPQRLERRRRGHRSQPSESESQGRRESGQAEPRSDRLSLGLLLVATLLLWLLRFPTLLGPWTPLAQALALAALGLGLLRLVWKG